MKAKSIFSPFISIFMLTPVYGSNFGRYFGRFSRNSNMGGLDAGRVVVLSESQRASKSAGVSQKKASAREGSTWNSEL